MEKVCLVATLLLAGCMCDISGYWYDGVYSEEVEFWEGTTGLADPMSIDDGREEVRVCGEILMLRLSAGLDLPRRAQLIIDGNICDVGEHEIIGVTLLESDEYGVDATYTELSGWTAEGSIRVDEGNNEEPDPEPGFGNLHVYQASEGRLEFTLRHSDGRTIVAPDGSYYSMAVAESCSN